MTDPAPAPLPIRFDDAGLVPVVVQDAESRDVLMVAFMNAEALAATRATGRTHFWSRSRGKLWRKGESSGHEQIVESIHVNCEQNSLLITVRQLGAVCHDGYDTCYYRRLEPDDTLTVVRDRVFDPATVYATPANLELEDRTRQWLAAYAYLRDHDLAPESGTSRRLRDPAFDPAPRIADELRELAGVLDGTHTHRDQLSDATLEGSQVLYWAALAATQAGIEWSRLRPDRALATTDDQIGIPAAAALLRAEAASWESSGALPAEILAARLHALVALVAQACRALGLPPGSLIDADLTDLRARRYLADFFGATPQPTPVAAPRPGS